MGDKQTSKTVHSSAGLLSTIGRAWAIRAELMATLRDLHGAALRGVDVTAALDVEARPALAKQRVGSGPNGVAVIPITGVITPSASILDILFGDSSGGLEGLRADLQDALADPDVGNIVLNIDSPGGIVDQVPETADLIRQARGKKPIVAVANTLAASAAYWLAAQAHEVVITPSGQVGSIGVFLMHQDWSKAMEMDGVKPTLVSAGKYKVDGSMYEPLSDTARTDMQQKVDDYYNLFTAAVAAGRGVPQADVQDGYGEGRTLTAKRAKSANLVDRVATLDETVSRLASGRARVQRQENAAGQSSDVLVWDDPNWGSEPVAPAAAPVALSDEVKDRLLDYALAK